MNFDTIRFHDAKLFGMALNVLSLDATPYYGSDSVALTITSDEIVEIANLLNENGIFMFDEEGGEDENDTDDREPNEDMDGDFDSAMASAGFGTNEDYEHNTCLGDE